MTSMSAAGAQQPPTLFAWAGGAEALSRLTRIFYGHVKTDPILAPVFAEMSPQHPEWVAQWLGEVFGGPATYTQERGGYPHMLSRHLGRALTEQQRARWVQLMGEAADEAALPADPEFRAAFVSYLEWGRGSRWPTASPGHSRRRACRCRTGTGARPARRTPPWARPHRRWLRKHPAPSSPPQ
jgi:hemoglobin